VELPKVVSPNFAPSEPVQVRLDTLHVGTSPPLPLKHRQDTVNAQAFPEFRMPSIHPCRGEDRNLVPALDQRLLLSARTPPVKRDGQVFNRVRDMAQGRFGHTVFHKANHSPLVYTRNGTLD